MGAIEESAGEKDGLEDLNTVHEQSCSRAVTRQAAASTKSFATKKQKQRKQGTNHSLNVWWQSASTHLPQPSFVVRSKHTQDTATIYGYTRVQACKQHVHTTRKHKPHTQTCVQCVRLRNASEYSNTQIANTIVMTSLKVAEYGGLEPIWHPCFSCSCSCCSCCT